MKLKNNYKQTLAACYLGFITQAIVANFAPLLFLTFHNSYGISLGRIALVSTVFYFTQLLVDVICAWCVDRISPLSIRKARISASLSISDIIIC